MKKNQKGVIHLQLIFIGLLVFAVVGFAGYKVFYKNKVNPTLKIGTTTTKTSSGKQTATANNSPTNQQGTSSQPTSTSSSKKTSLNSSINPPSPNSTSSGNNPSSPSSPTSTDPTIKVITPSSGEVITGNEITYSCSYTTPNGFSEVEANTYDQYGQDAHTGFTQGIESAGCSATLDITYLENGSYTVTFTVHDNTGKTASASTPFTVQH